VQVPQAAPAAARRMYLLPELWPGVPVLLVKATPEGLLTGERAVEQVQAAAERAALEQALLALQPGGMVALEILGPVAVFMRVEVAEDQTAAAARAARVAAAGEETVEQRPQRRPLMAVQTLEAAGEVGLGSELLMTPTCIQLELTAARVLSSSAIPAHSAAQAARSHRLAASPSTPLHPLARLRHKG
jgi:hypothetical protein